MNGMRFSVAALLKEPTGASRQRVIHVPPTTVGERTLVSPVQGKVKLLRVGPRRSQAGAILALGELATAVATECSRCLESATYPVSFSFEAAYYPQVDVATGRAVAPHQDDLGFDLSANHELDLTEAIRQHIELAMPMQPLCFEECAGLCAACGRNRNHESCSHKAAEIDPRLAPLQELLTSDALRGMM
ncbi:MAG: hypothetical protein CL878_12760 [Dehalococcoidia bacterium]|nr:hypothetical protein [Dehalococcoidia bacterium]